MKKTCICRSIGSTLLLAILALPWAAEQAAAETVGEANRMVEISFTAGKDHPDPFNTIDVDVTFTTPSSRVVRVPAFWAGGQTWRVRYASPEIGTHTYFTSCSDRTDKGLEQVTGRIEVIPYTGDNLLYRHGPVRIAADKRHFAHADGTPFFWLGDTWWMGLCERLRWPEEFHTLAHNRRTKGFTVVQIVAGLYPDMPAFDPRGMNEAGFPWTENYGRIRPEYFDLADRRIVHLVDQDLVPCVVMAWGYHLPWTGVEKMKKHVRCHCPLWRLARGLVHGRRGQPALLPGEGLPAGRKANRGLGRRDQYACTINGLERLITVHPTGIEPLSGRLLFHDQAVLDFDMLQTGHGKREVLRPTIHTMRASYSATPIMPVVNGEVSYEALLGTIPAEIPRLMFWTCMLSGARRPYLRRQWHLAAQSPRSALWQVAPWRHVRADSVG